MSEASIVELLFAVGIVLAALALAGAGFRLVGRTTLGVLVAIVGVLALAAWVAFAFDPSRSLAVSAAGLTLATVAASASFAVAKAMARVGRLDAELDRAHARLAQSVDQLTEKQAAELEHVVVRTHAEAISRLAGEERRIADERRVLVVERERAAAAELSELVSRTQKQIEQRLQDWSMDLDRSADAMRARALALGERQKQLLGEAEARIAADAERLEGESEGQRAAVARLRADVQRAMEETITAARAELDQQAADRRRALHEIGERLRRRERELTEQVEREETEAVGRIQASLGDVQRRQVEQLERAVARSTSSLADEAAQQFAALIKGAREDAARRLARELDRAVAAFAREAESMLAERLAQIGDAGAQRLERRLEEITATLDRRRDEFVDALAARFSDVEGELRRRLAELAADAEAERAVLEARVQDLARRLDESASLRAR
jgi:hypothetical protein